MDRRRYLATLGGAGVGALAGCTSLFETEAGREGRQPPPLVEDRPDAVYVPTHVEGMEMVGMASVGRLRIALSYSFPHRFWTVEGSRTNKVEIADEHDVHAMVSVRDAETGRSVPSSSATLQLRKDGELVVDRSLWSMLSQNMGFHYGDNVPLDGEGTYEATVAFGPVTSRRTGDFAGQFGERSVTSFEFEFTESDLDAISYTRLEDRQGERAAVEPMQMEMMRIPQLPETGAMPGTLLGSGTTGDGQFPAFLLDGRPAGVEGSGPYLAISARTPYNRYPLPFLPLSATLTRGGEAVFDGELTTTLDPDLGYHYGVGIGGVEAGDRLRIVPATAPQVARHEGYETAFVELSPVEFVVESV